MEKKILSAAEAAEYEEFQRSRREQEIAVRLKKTIADASRRDTDRAALQRACETAKKYGASGVLVSPVNVASAKRALSDRAFVVCLVGGTGESLPATKKTEAKKAVSQGAGEIRLVLCYSALTGKNMSYLKREIKKVKKAAKKIPLIVSLEDHSLTEEEVGFGVRAAREAKSDGVCVRGELSLVLAAANAGAARIDVSGVENAEQLNSLMRAGASLAVTPCLDTVAQQLYGELQNQGAGRAVSK